MESGLKGDERACCGLLTGVFSDMCGANLDVIGRSSAAGGAAETTVVGGVVVRAFWGSSDDVVTGLVGVAFVKEGTNRT